MWDVRKCSLDLPSPSKVGRLVVRTWKASKHQAQPGLESWKLGLERNRLRLKKAQWRGAHGRQDTPIQVHGAKLRYALPSPERLGEMYRSHRKHRLMWSSNEVWLSKGKDHRGLHKKTAKHWVWGHHSALFRPYPCVLISQKVPRFQSNIWHFKRLSREEFKNY